MLLLAPVVALAALIGACGATAGGPPMPGAGAGGLPVSAGGGQSGTQTSALPFPDTGSTLGAQQGAQVITFKVVGSDDGAVGPDGRRHDTFRATSSTTVAAGRPVTVEIENDDDMPHSFTMRELGIDRLVPAAEGGTPGRVTFSFTPTTAGTYRWYCALPCDLDNGGWAMGMYSGGQMPMGGMGRGMMEPGVDGFMAGYVTVTA